MREKSWKMQSLYSPVNLLVANVVELMVEVLASAVTVTVEPKAPLVQPQSEATVLELPAPVVVGYGTDVELL